MREITHHLFISSTSCVTTVSTVLFSTFPTLSPRPTAISNLTPQRFVQTQNFRVSRPTDTPTHHRLLYPSHIVFTIAHPADTLACPHTTLNAFFTFPRGLFSSKRLGVSAINVSSSSISPQDIKVTKTWKHKPTLFVHSIRRRLPLFFSLLTLSSKLYRLTTHKKLSLLSFYYSQSGCCIIIISSSSSSYIFHRCCYYYFHLGRRRYEYIYIS